MTSSATELLISGYIHIILKRTYVDEYTLCVGKITSILENSNVGDLMVLGDFNAVINGTFYNEWRHVCGELDVVFSDVCTVYVTYRLVYTHK